MQIGDIIHLDGLRAEYNFFGRDRFSACTLPDGDYVIVALEDNHIKLAWTDASGCPSRKHRYRIGKAACTSPVRVTEPTDRNCATTTPPGWVPKPQPLSRLRSIFFAFADFLHRSADIQLIDVKRSPKEPAASL